jgi:pimeloyl-ACP methyl ester carboxylesterase
MGTVRFRKLDVEGIKVFYREAGPKDAHTILLLYGFPTAGHMFRDLIPHLADRFRLVAPGQSDMPSRSAFTYTFENIANVIDRFTELLGLHRFAIYVFDYGAPVGFRLAARHPDRITAIVSQNGHAYEEGLSDGWSPIRAYWEEPSPANRERGVRKAFAEKGDCRYLSPLRRIRRPTSRPGFRASRATRPAARCTSSTRTRGCIVAPLRGARSSPGFRAGGCGPCRSGVPGALAIAEPLYGWITRRWGPVPRDRGTPRRHRLGARGALPPRD